MPLLAWTMLLTLKGSNILPRNFLLRYESSTINTFTFGLGRGGNSSAFLAGEFLTFIAPPDPPPGPPPGPLRDTPVALEREEEAEGGTEVEEEEGKSEGEVESLRALIACWTFDDSKNIPGDDSLGSLWPCP